MADQRQSDTEVLNMIKPLTGIILALNTGALVLTVTGTPLMGAILFAVTYILIHPLKDEIHANTKELKTAFWGTLIANNIITYANTWFLTVAYFRHLQGHGDTPLGGHFHGAVAVTALFLLPKIWNHPKLPYPLRIALVPVIAAIYYGFLNLVKI